MCICSHTHTHTHTHTPFRACPVPGMVAFLFKLSFHESRSPKKFFAAVRPPPFILRLPYFYSRSDLGTSWFGVSSHHLCVRIELCVFGSPVISVVLTFYLNLFFWKFSFFFHTPLHYKVRYPYLGFLKKIFITFTFSRWYVMPLSPFLGTGASRLSFYIP